MSNGRIITVASGIHAGASVALSDGLEMAIGSGENATFVLVDEGVAPHHATVTLNGNLLKLTALQDGVQVFGHALAPGRTTVLRYGATFTVGGVQIQFGERDALTARTMRSAELAWLKKYAPLDYGSKRWTLAPRAVKLMLLIVLLCACAGAIWQAYGPQDAQSSAPKLDGPFRFVTVHQDPKTHAFVYDGYVSSASDLASLAALVRRDKRASIMRVMVIDQIREQLADFLTRYYHGARIKVDNPGAFTVTPPEEDEGYLLPESWDYARVSRRASESINGLRELRFEGHVSESGPVRAPLGAIGMNLARSAHGAWLMDARGVRYFAGAQLPLGKISAISGCTVTIVRNDDGALYEFFAQGDDDVKKCD